MAADVGDGKVITISTVVEGSNLKAPITDPLVSDDRASLKPVDKVRKGVDFLRYRTITARTKGNR
jgi:hypothetical protein